MRTLQALLILLSLLSVQVSFAQNRSRLNGAVVDGSGKNAVGYASVSVSLPGGKVVDGTLTDSTGKFDFKNLTPGNYILHVESVGYKPFTLAIKVKPAGTQDLGALSLKAAVATLQEATVTAARPLVETHLDKIVYNAANDLTSQSGVALDVLKKVPFVTVDIDGNVELEGDANIRFLINGKPSTMFGASLADALQSIPASQVQSIEVIASPGAKYDASGTGGIINIVLKDNRVHGVNGSVNLSAGTRLENASVNLNAREKNFGLSAFFSGNAQLNTTNLSTIERQSYNNTRDTLTSLSQDGTNSVERRGYQTGLTFDWDLSARDKLTAGFTFEHFDNHTHTTAAQTQQTTDAKNDVLSSLPSEQVSSSQYQSNTADYSLDYKHSFHRKGTELEFLSTYSSGRNFADYQQQQSYPGSALANSGSVGNSPGTDKEADLSLDYKNAISEEFAIETGAKTVLETLNTSTVTDTLQPDGSYVNNASQTYGFTYNRQVYAGYISTEFSLFKKFLEGQAGMRYEYTHTTADFKGAAIPSYGLFFPSFVLSHSFNDDESLKIAYSHRIERPDYGDLNPFYNISDPHNISTGNPGLRPEKGYRYELGYNHKITGGSVYVGAFFRRNTDDIQAVSTYYATLNLGGVAYSDVTLSQRYNIGSQSSVGANIFGSLAVTNAFSLRTNIQIGSMTNESVGLGKSTGFLFRGNLNASYAFSSDFVAELFGNLHASMKTIQGTRPAFGYYTLAMRKQFWKKKASIGLTATNPFNKYIDQRSILYGSNFTQNQLRRVPYQSFGITLSYKFGKLEFKSKDHDDNNPPMPVE